MSRLYVWWIAMMYLVSSQMIYGHINDNDGVISQAINAIMHLDEKKDVLNDIEIRARAYFDDGQQNVIKKQKYICVSLGSDCTSAWYLEKYHLRKLAFPFDWLLTPSVSIICTLMENHFKDFLKPHCLASHPFFLSNKRYDLGFINTQYNIGFIHEDIGTYGITFESVCAKYQRRIKRFYSLADLAETVYFFRVNHTTKTEAVTLREALGAMLPKMNWTLVVVNKEQEHWDIPNIKTYRISSFELEGDQASAAGKDPVSCEWKVIFKDLGLM